MPTVADLPEFPVLLRAIDDLVALVDSLADADFDAPSRCPTWHVAELVAHCEGVLTRLVGDDAAPVELSSIQGVDVGDRVDYYRFDPDAPRAGDSSGRTMAEAIRVRVLDEGAGRSPAALRRGLTVAARHVREHAAPVDSGRLIHRAGHPPMTYGEFVAVRNVEIGVHTLDIAAATGRAEVLDAEVADVVVGVLDGLLGQARPPSVFLSDVDYILVGTGRLPLDPDAATRLGELSARFPLFR